MVDQAMRKQQQYKFLEEKTQMFTCLIEQKKIIDFQCKINPKSHSNNGHQQQLHYEKKVQIGIKNNF